MFVRDDRRSSAKNLQIQGILLVSLDWKSRALLEEVQTPMLLCPLLQNLCTVSSNYLLSTL